MSFLFLTCKSFWSNSVSLLAALESRVCIISCAIQLTNDMNQPTAIFVHVKYFYCLVFMITCLTDDFGVLYCPGPF